MALSGAVTCWINHHRTRGAAPWGPTSWVSALTTRINVRRETFSLLPTPPTGLRCPLSLVSESWGLRQPLASPGSVNRPGAWAGDRHLEAQGKAAGRMHRG